MELLAVLHPLLALGLGHVSVVHGYHGSGIHEKVGNLIVHYLFLIHSRFGDLKPSQVWMPGPGEITKFVD